MKRLLVSTAVAATMAVSSTALAAGTNANMNGAAKGNAAATMPANGNAGGNTSAAGNANATANGSAIQTPKVISLNNWDYDKLYTSGWSAENFIDHMKVVGQNGNKIGKVDDLVIAPDGRLLSVVIEVGGFWKINDRRAAVPWNEVKVQSNSIVTPVTKNNVAQYSYFNYSGLPGSKIALNGNNNGGGLFGGNSNDNNGAMAQNTLGNGQGNALGGGNNGQIMNGNAQMNAGGGQSGNMNGNAGMNRQANNAGGGMGNGQQARPWRVSELIGSYARLKGPNGNVNYGYVRDLIIRNGQVVATVVDAHNGVGARGYYAYPYYGYAGGWGWGWAAPYYNLPYNQRQAAQMPTFDYSQMKTQFNQG